MVGWNYETVDFSLDARGAGVRDIQEFKHTYRFQGLSLGLRAAVMSRSGIGAIANFVVLVPGNNRDTENYNDGLPVVQMSRNWHTKNDTYYFDGMGFYRVFNGAALVGGFRWDHLETTFNRPGGVVIIAGLPTDEEVLTANVFQPYVGAMIDQGSPSRVLRVRFIVWPQLYGNVRYEETVGAHGVRDVARSRKLNGGYFWEIYGEYGLKDQMFAEAALSIFGKWTQYHFSGDSNVVRNVIGVGRTLSDTFAISLHRNSWTAGLKIDIPLALPIPFYF